MKKEIELKGKWRKIPFDIKQKLLTMYLIINSGEEYTIEQYKKYVAPVAEYDVSLSFFDIPCCELPETKNGLESK